MLNKKQIRQLKSLAQTSTNRYKIGKNEISESVIDLLDKAIEKHELIKVDVLQSVASQKEDFAKDLVNALHAELVTIIGNVIVLYRKNLKKPNIKLVD